MIALYIIGGIAIVFVVLALLAPKETKIQREITVSASPGEVYAHLRSLETFVQWSPWTDRDPNSKITFSGTDGQVGSRYHWSGNREVGEGEMEIMDLDPGNKVGVALRFMKPWKSTADTNFLIDPQGEGAQITWAFRSENKLPSSIFMLFMNMDKMLGNDFEKGLKNYKSMVEEGLPTS